MNIKNYRIYILFIFALCCNLLQAAEPTAASILQGVRNKMVSRPAVDVVFTIKGDGGDFQGSATIAGASFFFKTPQIAVWYDGKTQWTYLTSSREVNITEPSFEEITASNPFAILNNYQGNYNYRRLPDAGGRHRVRLEPLDKNSPVNNIILVVDPATNWPAAIALSFDDNRKVDVVIDKISGKGTVPETTFVYAPAMYPADEIIDLR